MHVFRVVSLSLFIATLVSLGTAAALLDAVLVLSRRAIGMQSAGFIGQTVASLMCVKEAGDDRSPGSLLDKLGSGVQVFVQVVLWTRLLVWAGLHVLHQIARPFATVVPAVGAVLGSATWTGLLSTMTMRTLFAGCAAAFVVLPFSSDGASDYAPIMDFLLALPETAGDLARGAYLWVLDLASVF